MAVLGNTAVLVALLASVGAAISYARAIPGGGKTALLGRTLLRLCAAATFLASALLLTLILRHDYSVAYVYSYSDNALPLYYLVSSFYAGQGGSFLFWSLCSAFLALLLSRYTSRRQREPWVMAVFMGVQTFLLLLVAVKSPFESIWSAFPQAPLNQIPANGSGLNPLLQNFWMVVHPPVLFLGFAALAAPFSLAVGGLWKKDYAILIEHGFAWVIFSAAILGLGIMLGAYWAYGVLGWGGYWGWDPVENSSLVPWLTVLAMLHTMLAQHRARKYIGTNFLLAIVSFLLVVYSTFLTRSGILGDASVHSFTDPGAAAYWLLLAFLASLGAAGFGLMYARRRDLAQKRADIHFLTRETALGAGALLLAISAATILFGTSLPIFSKIRVEPSFYNTVNLPIAIGIALLIGMSLFTQWEMQDAMLLMRKALTSLAGALLATAVVFVFGVRDTAMLLFVYAALFALFVNVEMGITVARGNPLFLGGKIAHIGIALFLLGVISTGRYDATARVALPLGRQVQVLGYGLTYSGYEQRPDGKVAFTVAGEKDGRTFTLAPMMFDAGQQGVMRTPDIKSFPTRDFYLSPVSLDQTADDTPAGEETFTIEKGKSVSIGGVRATFVRFDMSDHGDPSRTRDGTITVGSIIELTDARRTETVVPKTIYGRDQQPRYQPSASALMNASIRLVSMNIAEGSSRSSVTIQVVKPESGPAQPASLVVEASVKPYINLLWGGTLLMVGGFLVSMIRRMRGA